MNISILFRNMVLYENKSLKEPKGLSLGKNIGKKV
jgi:hypothetical protein